MYLPIKCSDFQPNCNDVLKDFTMWWEINTFISVQHLSRVLCLVNSCSLTISQKKNQTQTVSLERSKCYKCLRLSTAVCKWFKQNLTVWTMCVSYGSKTGFCYIIVKFWMKCFILQKIWDVLLLVCVDMWTVCSVLTKCALFLKSCLSNHKKL